MVLMNAFRKSPIALKKICFANRAIRALFLHTTILIMNAKKAHIPRSITIKWVLLISKINFIKLGKGLN